MSKYSCTNCFDTGIIAFIGRKDIPCHCSAGLELIKRKQGRETLVSANDDPEWSETVSPGLIEVIIVLMIVWGFACGAGVCWIALHL